MWVYKKNSDNSARYVLGEINQASKKPLVCIGVNPSTAEPDHLDNTLTSVRNHSRLNQFDSWIMFNLYPQRATDPNKLHRALDEKAHKKNLAHIKEILGTHSNVTVWAAWGGLIAKRPFLKKCLEGIVEVIKPHPVKWVCRGKLVADKHPHHPLYLKRDLPFQPFDIERYLEKIKE